MIPMIKKIIEKDAIAVRDENAKSTGFFLLKVIGIYGFTFFMVISIFLKKMGQAKKPAPSVIKTYCKPFAFQYPLILSFRDFGRGT